MLKNISGGEGEEIGQGLVLGVAEDEPLGKLVQREMSIQLLRKAFHSWNRPGTTFFAPRIRILIGVQGQSPLFVLLGIK